MRALGVPLQSATERANYINSTVEGCLVASAVYVISGFIGVYALEVGASNAEVGWLVALPFLANTAAVLVAGRALARRDNLMKPMQLAATLHRLFLLAMLLAPMLPALSVWWIIILYSLASASMAVSAATWTSLVSDMFPVEHRGAIFGTRALFTGSAGVIATLLAGKFLDLLTTPLNYTVVFVIVALMALCAVHFLGKLQVTSGPPEVRPPGEAQWHPLVAGGTSRLFRQLALPVFFFLCGYYLLAPVLNIYFVERLALTKSQIGLLTSAFLVCQVVSMRFWGKMGDIVGNHAVACVSMVALAMQAFAYLWRPGLLYLFFMQGFGGFAFGGYAISTFNALIGMGSKRERHLLVTWFNVVSSLAGFVSPIAGAYVLDLVDMPAAFLLAAATRAAGAVLLCPPAGQEWCRFRRTGALLGGRRR